MATFLSDGWFYISAAGLLVSGALFFFLLGQYRAASEAADQPAEPQPETPVELPSAIVRPVMVSDESAGETPSADRLQKINVELEKIRGELHDLSQVVTELKNSVMAAVSAAPPAPKRVRRAKKTEVIEQTHAAPTAAELPTPPTLPLEPVSPPIAAEPSPPPLEEPPVPVPSLVIEPTKIQVAPEAAKVTIPEEPGALKAAVAPVAEQPAAPDEKPRRGPVWPV